MPAPSLAQAGDRVSIGEAAAARAGDRHGSRDKRPDTHGSGMRSSVQPPIRIVGLGQIKAEVDLRSAGAVIITRWPPPMVTARGAGHGRIVVHRSVTAATSVTAA
jgi:hypothetical protein